MKIPLSDRLMTCCSYIHPGDRVADVGCDHGYLGIYLLSNNIASFVLASDVNPMPLNSARENAKKHGVNDKILFTLSDGVQSLPRDFDCMVCAGMGADTMISILSAAPWLKSDQYRLILQCQSKRPILRKYLYEEGYRIRRETLAKDGKFYYPVMEVVYAPDTQPAPDEFYISSALKSSGSPLLPAFLRRVIDGLQKESLGLQRSDYNAYLQMNQIIKKLTQDLEELTK